MFKYTFLGAGPCVVEPPLSNDSSYMCIGFIGLSLAMQWVSGCVESSVTVCRGVDSWHCISLCRY